MATFAGIVTQVEENTGRDDKTAVIQTRVTQALNEIQRRGTHYFMEELATRVLVVNEQDYSVPSDFKDIKNIYLLEADGTWTKDRPLDQWSLEEGRFEFNADDTGDPVAYTIFRKAIWVWPPKPQDAAKKLHLEYYKFIDPITGAQTNELTLVWPDLVEAWATWKFYSGLPHAVEEASFWQKMAGGLYADLTVYSNQYRLRGKVVMKVRTTPRMVSGRRQGRVFGGR